MEAINRRGFLRSMVGGAAVVTIATPTGALLPTVTEAATVPADKNHTEWILDGRQPMSAFGGKADITQ